MKAFLVAIALAASISFGVFAQKPRAVTAAEANGTYRSRNNEIRILALGGGKLKVKFDLSHVYGPAESGMVNTGEATGEATIENNVAIFSTADSPKCKITMTFLPSNKLKVVQQGSDSDCGFGQNVTADGTYRKIDGRKPTFD